MRAKELIRAYTASQNRQLQLIGIEAFVCTLALLNLPYREMASHMGLVSLVIAVAFAQSFEGYVVLLFTKKKKISDISDSAQMGAFDRQLLIDTVENAKANLGLEDLNIQTYLTGDKDVNAYLTRVGLSRLFPSLNGIYINRSLLHILTPMELQSVIGHELGHATAYQQTWSKYLLLHTITTAALSLWVLCALGQLSTDTLLLIIAVQGITWFLMSIPYSSNPQTIEYLCDHHGLLASSLNGAIGAELKIGKACENHHLLLTRIIESSQAKLSTKAILKIYQSSLSYHSLNEATLDQSIRDAVNRAQQSSGMSFKGLFDHIWNGDEDSLNLAEEKKATSELIKNIPRLAWEKEIQFDSSKALEDWQISKLDTLIKTQAPSRLFSAPHDIPMLATSHPPTTDRVKFILTNRWDVLE